MTDGKWMPGKGFFGHGNEEVIRWLHEVFEDISNAMGEDGELNDLLDEKDVDGAKEFMGNVFGSAAGWRKEKDKFGTKLYKELLMGEDGRGTPIKYRATLVANSNGPLSIDVRQWYMGD
jgi:hypothetical protein